jgi:hypothetical protein
MKMKNVWPNGLVSAFVSLLMISAGAFAQQVVPPAPIQVSSLPGTSTVVINASAGDQTDPHISKDLAAYTDAADNRIHYYRFSTAADAAIPPGTAVGPDSLSDVSGNHVCFSRQENTAFEIGLFDSTTSAVTEIDPHPGNVRLGCALGGDTLIFVDFGTGSGAGNIFFYDLAANPPSPQQPLSLDPNEVANPNVSPDGNVVVWENCPTPSNCDIWKAVRSAGAWTTSIAVNSSFNEQNPDTDGTWIAYDTNQGAATGQDIYFLPVASGQTTQLLIPGAQVNPSISQGVIAFESTVPPSLTPEIYVYIIASNTLYQVTATPGVSEQLNDLSVLDNGDIRVVWAADDGPTNGFRSELNIYATTFTPTHRTTYNICPLYDQNVAKKAGSAYPIKIQLCDGSGNNLSAPSIVVHALGVTRVSTNTPATLDDTGNANPDFDFRYDATISGYVFNLSTRGYATGTYDLNFTAGSDPTQHSALFAVK